LSEETYAQLVPDENQHYWIEEISLSLGVWRGKKAEVTAHWLRWWDGSGNLLLWGSEQLVIDRQRAELAQAELEKERALNQKLAQKLRELGVEPEMS
jgi:hypothetical protein